MADSCAMSWMLMKATLAPSGKGVAGCWERSYAPSVGFGAGAPGEFWAKAGLAESTRPIASGHLLGISCLL